MNFIKNLLKKPKIAITGLNPHCESFDKENKEKNEIIPAIKYLKKKNTVFKDLCIRYNILRQNIKKFDVILGMYHTKYLGL